MVNSNMYFLSLKGVGLTGRVLMAKFCYISAFFRRVVERVMKSREGMATRE